MPFYIELPAYANACTAMPMAVYEARIVPGGSDEAPSYSNTERQVILFTAPEDIAERHLSMYVDSYGGYAEVDGPARTLTYDEYHDILASVAERARAEGSA
jgi:hypothetical protein